MNNQSTKAYYQYLEINQPPKVRRHSYHDLKKTKTTRVLHNSFSQPDELNRKDFEFHVQIN
jgi:hypothetical protein